MPRKVDPATRQAQIAQWNLIDDYVIQFQETRHSAVDCPHSLEGHSHAVCKKRNQEASRQLLEKFSAYIDRFVYQIKNARIRPRRRHVWDESFPRRYSHWLKMYSAEDVKQDLVILFFRCVEKYDIKFKEIRGVNFCGYLNRAFILSLKDYLYNSICHLTDGPYSYVEDRDVSDFNAPVGYGDRGEGQDFDHFEGLARDPGMANPEDWIQGLTAAPPFDYLSPEDRYLIYLRYVENKTFRQIAKTVGLNDRQTQEQMKGILAEIEAVSNALNLLYTEEELQYRI